MAIFSRRHIQRMLDENEAFLTFEQLNQQVTKLNGNNFQSLDAEWEVSVLNAFSKLGGVIHEPNLEGSAKLDLLFSLGETQFLADITSVSDEGFEEKASVKAFHEELKQHLEKAGLLYKGWSLSIGEHPVKHGTPRKPALPLRSEFKAEIFNSRFRKFLSDVINAPDQSHTYSVNTKNTAISLTYLPDKNSFMSRLPVYNTAVSKDHNPVFNALRAKAKQHKKVAFDGFRGIILCDGGCGMFLKKNRNSVNFNAVDATKDFLRQNQSIDLVILLSCEWIDGRAISSWAMEPSHNIRAIFVGNSSYSSLPADLKSCLGKLDQQFPEPINTADGARESIRSRYDPKSLRPLSGGIDVEKDKISISASAVLALLAGKITQDELFESLCFTPNNRLSFSMRNQFEYMLSQNKRIIGVEIQDTKHDDSKLIFKFDGPDPATSDFTNPKDGELCKN